MRDRFTIEVRLRAFDRPGNKWRWRVYDQPEGIFTRREVHAEGTSRTRRKASREARRARRWAERNVSNDE